MMKLLSGAAIRRPILVIVIWVAVVAAGYGVGIGVFERLTAAVGGAPGSESERAQALLATGPATPESVTAVVVGRDATDPALVNALSQVRNVHGVTKVDGPRRSADGRALLYEIVLDPYADGAEDAAATAAQRLRDVDPANVTVAGGALSDEEFGNQAQSDVQRAEIVTMPVLLVLLVFVFGGLLAGALPIVVAIVGVGGTFGLLYAFSHVTDVSVYAIQLATMLSIGLAVDYGLLIIARFREQRAVEPDVRVALSQAMATAGRTVFFTGLTAAVSLCGLTVFPDPFLRSMGIAGAGVVVVDMLAALTLLPALLALVGRRIKPAAADAGTGVFARVAALVQRRPVLVTLLTAGFMVLLALPATSLRLVNSDARALPASTQTRLQYEALETHFPELVGTESVTAAVRAGADDPRLAGLRDQIAALPAVSTVDVRRLSDGASALIATVREGEGRDVATRVRDLPAPFEVLVTGNAAHLMDYKAMLVEYAPWAALVVVLGTLLLLFAFTGSVLLPVKAVLTTALSIGAAYGVIVWVFQRGHFAELFGAQRLGGIDLTVPVLVAAIAFGLSVDYEAFLLSRMRERWAAGVAPDQAVAEGLQRTGKIVTSAALLLIIVFVGFLLGGFAPIKEVGLGLVLAIALDATIVRMLLVPASMTLFGKYNWWAPRPLRALHERLSH